MIRYPSIMIAVALTLAATMILVEYTTSSRNLPLKNCRRNKRLQRTFSPAYKRWWKYKPPAPKLNVPGSGRISSIPQHGMKLHNQRPSLNKIFSGSSL